MPSYFRLNDFGRAFATRGRAAELREELLNRVETNASMIIDFAGVANVSYSFADEFAGKLAADDSICIEPINMAAGVARTVQSAIERRIGGPVAC